MITYNLTIPVYRSSSQLFLQFVKVNQSVFIDVNYPKLKSVRIYGHLIPFLPLFLDFHRSHGYKKNEWISYHRHIILIDEPLPLTGEFPLCLVHSDSLLRQLFPQRQLNVVIMRTANCFLIWWSSCNSGFAH